MREWLKKDEVLEKLHKIYNIILRIVAQHYLLKINKFT